MNALCVSFPRISSSSEYTGMRGIDARHASHVENAWCGAATGKEEAGHRRQAALALGTDLLTSFAAVLSGGKEGACEAVAGNLGNALPALLAASVEVHPSPSGRSFRFRAHGSPSLHNRFATYIPANVAVLMGPQPKGTHLGSLHRGSS